VFADAHGKPMMCGARLPLSLHGHRRTRSAAPWLPLLTNPFLPEITFLSYTRMISTAKRPPKEILAVRAGKP